MSGQVSDRFAALTKIPRQPAAKLLSLANVTLDTELTSPAVAPVEEVLTELEARAAVVDMLKLLAVALPVRERIWWACLAARDTLAPGAKVPPPLAAAEAWVFRPTEENRAAAKLALDTAAVKDDTVHCATAVLFCDGMLGPGDLKQYEAPPAAGPLSVFAMNVLALCRDAEHIEANGRILVDRALDIARGGSGTNGAAADREQEAANAGSTDR